MNRVAVVQLAKVFRLCRRQDAAYPDCGVFVASHTAVQDLLGPRLGVEIPLAGGIFLQGNRERPVLGTDEQRLVAVRFSPPAIHLFEAADEVITAFLVLDIVARREDALGGSA